MVLCGIIYAVYQGVVSVPYYKNKCQNEHSYMRYVIGEITVRDKGTPVQNRQREFRL